MYISAGTLIVNTKATTPSILCVHQKYSYALNDVFYYGQREDYHNTINALMRLSEKEWELLKSPHGIEKICADRPLSANAIKFIRRCIEKYNRIYPFERNALSGVWSVPKGRIQQLEHEIDAAIRETCEETNLNPNDFSLLHTRPIIINYVGSNSKKYRLILYLARAEKTHGVTGVIENQEIDISTWVEINKLEKIPEYGRILRESLRKKLKNFYR